ncbi:MAG: integrase DNA-binding domain-containing protein, partial [Lachnospiraceae bacterium]|nr:integrase DNA-binding domain-containing protein [Lachnospiraceae bacterium]
MGKRRDSKGRILRTGESQKKNGRYVFQYTDFSGKRRCVYSSRLEKTDRYPEGALKKDKALREKEEEILFNKANGLFDFGGDLTVIELAERYVATRTSVKESTKAGYRTTLNFLRKEPFSQKRIDKVKQTEVKLWMIKLQQEDGRRYSSIRN